MYPPSSHKRKSERVVDIAEFRTQANAYPYVKTQKTKTPRCAGFLFVYLLQQPLLIFFRNIKSKMLVCSAGRHSSARSALKESQLHQIWLAFFCPEIKAYVF